MLCCLMLLLSACQPSTPDDLALTVLQEEIGQLDGVIMGFEMASARPSGLRLDQAHEVREGRIVLEEVRRDQIEKTARRV